MDKTPRTQELREDLAGISPEGKIWKLFKKMEDMERDLNAVTEQRDDLLRYNEAFRKETLICADCDAISKEEYDQAIEQRDRLAEALKVADECLEMANFSKYGYTRRMINEALQSLTTNDKSDGTDTSQKNL